MVTTTRAMAGIGLSEREGLFVADTPEGFADKVSSVLQDHGLRRELRNGASMRSAAAELGCPPEQDGGVDRSGLPLSRSPIHANWWRKLMP